MGPSNSARILITLVFRLSSALTQTFSTIALPSPFSRWITVLRKHSNPSTFGEQVTKSKSLLLSTEDYQADDEAELVAGDAAGDDTWCGICLDIKVTPSAMKLWLIPVIIAASVLAFIGIVFGLVMWRRNIKMKKTHEGN